MSDVIAPPHPVAVRRFMLRLSQHELAARAGVNKNTISRMEAGEPPSMRTATAVARALGADLDDLFPITD